MLLRKRLYRFLGFKQCMHCFCYSKIKCQHSRREQSGVICLVMALPHFKQIKQKTVVCTKRLIKPGQF